MSLNDRLGEFTGSDDQYQHSLLRNFTYTEGVQHVAKTYGAYWLIDAIASYQPQLKKEEFQVWDLKVKDNTAVLTCKADSGLSNLIKQEIPYTDFPEDIKLWVSHSVLMLPSEY